MYSCFNLNFFKNYYSITKILILSLLTINYCECRGLDRSHIVGGETTVVGHLPFIVSIEYFGDHRCGGSIISPDLILTAAHCTIGKVYVLPQYLKVRAGTVRREQDGQLRDVMKVITHPLYDQNGNMEYDIAIYKLKKSFNFGKNVNKIKLVNYDFEPKKNSKGIVAGWGLEYSTSNHLSDELRFVEVNIYKNDKCKKLYETERLQIANTTFCAGDDIKGGKDACSADSGGPFVIGKGKNRLQLGVVTAGMGCGVANIPGLYTSVPLLRNWIDDTVKELNNLKETSAASGHNNYPGPNWADKSYMNFLANFNNFNGINSN